MQPPKTMKTFLIIWLGQLLSMIGSRITGFALAVWIMQTTGQATPFALTAFFSVLPRLLLSPLAGVLADRVNRKKIMIISDSLAGLVTLVAAVLLFTNQLEVWMVYVVSFISAVCGTFQQPAYMASVTLLVPKEQLSRAVGMVQMGGSIADVLTPVIAGALFVGVGMKGIIAIDLITLLLAIACLIFMKIPQPVRTENKDGIKTGMLQDFLAGMKYLGQRQGLLGLMVFFAMVNFFLNISAILTGPLILSIGGAVDLGIVQTLWGVAMLAGSLIFSAWGGPKNKVRAVFGFIALSALGFTVAGFSANIWLITTGFVLCVFFIPMASASSQVVFQAKVSPDIQGRVFATRGMISQAMMPLAYLLAGPLADKVFNPMMIEGGALADTFIGDILGVGVGRGTGLMYVLSGLILVVICGLVYLIPRIRNLESEIPDVEVVPEQAAPTMAVEQG